MIGFSIVFGMIYLVGFISSLFATTDPYAECFSSNDFLKALIWPYVLSRTIYNYIKDDLK